MKMIVALTSPDEIWSTDGGAELTLETIISNILLTYLQHLFISHRDSMIHFSHAQLTDIAPDIGVLIQLKHFIVIMIVVILTTWDTLSLGHISSGGYPVPIMNTCPLSVIPLRPWMATGKGCISCQVSWPLRLISQELSCSLSSSMPPQTRFT